MKTYIVEGQYTLLPESRQWAIPGSERRYWDIITVEDEDDLTAYFAGQQDFIEEREEPVNFGQEARDARRQPPEHVCARCERPCKPQFRYCYRCHQYLQVKAKIRAS